MRSWMSSASSLGSSVGLGGDAARPELPCTEPAVLLRPPHRCSHSLLTRSALEHRRYLNGPGRPPISGFGFALSSGPIRGGWPLERFAPRHDWVIGPGPPPEALTRPPGPAIKPAGAKRTSTSTRHDMLRSSAALLPLLLGVCFAGCSTKARTFDTPEESSSGGSAGDKGKSSGGSGSGTGGQGGSHSEEPEPTGPCKDHQCQNGAGCEPDGDEDYTCLCAEGFEGDRCEVDIDECADDPCENRSEEHTSELQSRPHLVCRLLLEKKNKAAEIAHSVTSHEIARRSGVQLCPLYLHVSSREVLLDAVLDGVLPASHHLAAAAAKLPR